MENKLKRSWTKDVKLTITDMPNDFYLVEFSSDANYNHALFEGPWQVADHYLIVQRWQPFFVMTAEETRKIHVWIRIPRLPIELYSKTFLDRVGASLGTMLNIDRLTSIHSRGKFVRICVEVDLQRPLKSHIMVCGYPILLEYEGLHSIYFQCGKYGHKKDQCREILDGCSAAPEGQGEKPPEEPREPTDGGGTAPGEPVTIMVSADTQGRDCSHEIQGSQEIGYGPWMIPKRNPRRKGRPVPNGKDAVHGGNKIDVNQRQDPVHLEGSRFNALKGEQEANISNDRAIIVVGPSVADVSKKHHQTVKVCNPKAGKNPQGGGPEEKGGP